MNRKILFRGKDSNNQWVYGYYEVTRITGEHIINSHVDGRNYVVDGETVGQFTGCVYRGQNLFEGDVLLIPGNESYEQFQIVFVDCAFYAVNLKNQYSTILDEFLDYHPDLIGTIYD